VEVLCHALRSPTVYDYIAREVTALQLLWRADEGFHKQTAVSAFAVGALKFY